MVNISIRECSDEALLQAGSVPEFDEEFLRRPHLWPMGEFFGETVPCCRMKLKNKYIEAGAKEYVFGIIIHLAGKEKTLWTYPIVLRKDVEIREIKFDDVSELIEKGWVVD